MMDRSGFTLFYEETCVGLRLYVGKMIGRCSQVDDIMQEAYLRVLTSAPAGLAGRQLQAYLFSTATNIVRDSWRRGAVAGEWMPLDEESAPARSDTEDVLTRIDTERALAGLSILQRSLVWLAYGEGYSHREIAATTGVKEKSVKVLLYRARQKLICELKKSSEPHKERT
ncbi:MAG: RNA polymerase sigma factor [Candidatus Zixiibacteriota bacterium]|nr:MAG: RNA polymerase sigma factor [candidate division Zixibacteria bacterium]